MKNAQATRERLIAAARRAFARQGFERTTVREIAAEAGANPALINRYFGGKEQLFAESVAIDLNLPDPSTLARETAGATLIAHFFKIWEGRDADDLLPALIRTAVTSEDAAARIRTVLTGQIAPMVSAIAAPDRAGERAVLVATQILGLAYARYVLGLHEAHAPRATVEAMVGATLQRYLFDPLPR